MGFGLITAAHAVFRFVAGAARTLSAVDHSPATSAGQSCVATLSFKATFRYQPADRSAWPGDRLPATPVGFDPSQPCSCLKVSGRLQPFAPTCRYPEHPFELYMQGPNPDTGCSKPVPGLYPFGQSAPPSFEWHRRPMLPWA